MTDASEYDAFAADYEWIFSDDALTCCTRVERLKPLLAALPADPVILDGACGTGLMALALARKGLRVEGADASREMIARAREHARTERLDMLFTICSWSDLPEQFERKFDLVLCCGNAIGHCRDEEEMIRSLGGIKGVLKDEGRLLIDTRNWRKLLAERKRFTAFNVRERDGVRCIPTYVWSFPERLGDPVVVEVVFVFDREGEVTLRDYRVTYYPFLLEELTDRLRKAGFVDVHTDHADDADAYKVIARRG